MLSKLFAVIVVAIIGISVSSYLYYTSDTIQIGQTQPVDNDPTLPVFTTYENETFGIKIDYPEGWIVKSNRPTSVQFVPYDVSAEDMWKNPLFAVTAAPINKYNQNASEYANNYLNDLNDNALMEKVDYTITDTMLLGVDAIMVELEVKTFGQEIKSVVYYVQAREMIYVIGYNAPVSEYESNLDIANEMLSSFRLI